PLEPPPKPSERRKSALARERAAARQHRILIEHVTPEIDAGRYPAKRVVGDRLEVEADIFRAGHEVCAAALLWRPGQGGEWSSAPMLLHQNDRWVGSFELRENRRHLYTIEAWTDLYASWARAIGAKDDAGQEVALKLTEGRKLVDAAARRAPGKARRLLAAAAEPPPDGMPI